MIGDSSPAEVALDDQINAQCRDLLTAATHALLAVTQGKAVESAAAAYVERVDAVEPEMTRELLSRMCTTAARELVNRALAHGELDEQLCACPGCRAADS